MKLLANPIYTHMYVYVYAYFCCSVTKSCPLFVTPWTAAHQASLYVYVYMCVCAYIYIYIYIYI